MEIISHIIFKSQYFIENRQPLAPIRNAKKYIETLAPLRLCLM